MIVSELSKLTCEFVLLSFSNKTSCKFRCVGVFVRNATLAHEIHGRSCDEAKEGGSGCKRMRHTEPEFRAEIGVCYERRK